MTRSTKTGRRAPARSVVPSILARSRPQAGRRFERLSTQGARRLGRALGIRHLVRSGHCAASARCPLYPRKQTSAECFGMSALKRTFCAAAERSLFDHLVGAREQGRDLWLRCNARQDSFEKCHSCNVKFWIWQLTPIKFIESCCSGPPSYQGGSMGPNSLTLGILRGSALAASLASTTIFVAAARAQTPFQTITVFGESFADRGNHTC